MIRRWWRAMSRVWGYCDHCGWRGPKRLRVRTVLKDLSAHTCGTRQDGT